MYTWGRFEVKIFFSFARNYRIYFDEIWRNRNSSKHFKSPNHFFQKIFAKIIPILEKSASCRAQLLLSYIYISYTFSETFRETNTVFSRKFSRKQKTARKFPPYFLLQKSANIASHRIHKNCPFLRCC
jgi:hypothetical protein